MVQVSVRVAAAVAAATLLTCGPAAPALAGTPSPEPAATSTAAAPRAPSPTPSPDPATSPTPSPSSTSPASEPSEASASPEPTATASPQPTATSSSTPAPGKTAPSTSTHTRAADEALTLAVTPVGGAVAGSFYEDFGSFGFSGSTNLADGSKVEVQRRTGATSWTTVATASVANHAYAARSRVQGRGSVTFRASAKGTEGAPLTSPSTTVSVKDATISIDVAGKVDSLKNITVRGRVVPARSAMEVRVDQRRGSTWRNVAKTRTGADGTFSTSLSFGKGRLEGYVLRTTFHAVNRPRWELSGTRRTSRVAVLDPETDATTRADVAKTYRNGCPVGPSRLTTIHLNYYGRDKRMHRGVIVVRTDLRQRIVRAFDTALKHRYPIDKMKNPNDYGGNDPRQMKANNTSGFNCRKVVGNPYAQSPHSYGIAIDVNTVQNPYRDDNGKWWPSNGKKYRDRSPLRLGMLGLHSSLTKSLRKDHYFWGGQWDPGRDYQHFEYRG